ncbi:MAG: carboxypeptidase M32, partial [Sandaracinaceae bacterium]|nr:carboxypeptidase M32 [Sandaracinaceae bacterium]MDW8245121.1 carboxypeptidase M32 [Sandaracinaceae bacterium]
MSWKELVEHLKEIEVLESIAATLGWDEQTYMPKKAVTLRGSQMGLLAKLIHERRTDPRIESWLEGLDTSDPVQAACARNLGRLYRREKRVPPTIVEALAKARSEGFRAWLEAKARSDWGLFLPALDRLIRLVRERAQAIDPTRHPYEVLLEDYEPGITLDWLTQVFTRLKGELMPLIDEITKKPPFEAIDDPVPLPLQWQLSHRVAQALGFDFDGGRLDHSEHPFSTGQGYGDVRMTTHLKERDVLGGLGSTIHETGHALYEQGLPHELSGTTVREGASFGLHESQSRFWENIIARSKPFAIFLSRTMSELWKADCPARLRDPEAIHRAQNRVERTLIRTQADELTYNIHIIIRFEIEKALFEDALEAAEIPRVWNEKYQAYLGVVPPTVSQGPLQDVHWSEGLFGYFPSYTLGNIYAASLAKQMEVDIPSMWVDVENGDFSKILAWLRERIHQKGHIEETPSIIKQAVGER